MEIKTILNHITEELANCYQEMDEAQLRELSERIKKANRIFVAGAGRSLFMIRGLAMRLMHIGFTSYVVGETVTPAIAPGDLLLIASGSGCTSTLVTIANTCKKIGADLALITIFKDSPIGKLADHVVEVPAATAKTANHGKASIQPGGNTFEQSVLLIGDAIIMDMISNASMEENNTMLMNRHANLE